MSGHGLYVIGSSPAVPRPNRANSSYLFRSGDTSVVLDLGSGALAKLLAVQNIATLDAVIVSHMHADHFFDLVPLRYALKYEVRRTAPLPVFLPPGGLEALGTVVSPFRSGSSFFEGTMQLREYDPESVLTVAGARISFAKTRHYIDAYAIRVALDGKVVVFSADTAPEPRVAALAREADIFICECSLGAANEERGDRGHSNAREAGTMAAQAAAKHLLLTHYPASERVAELERAAGAAFGGTITVADDGLHLPLE